LRLVAFKILSYVNVLLTSLISAVSIVQNKGAAVDSELAFILLFKQSEIFTEEELMR